MPEIRPHPSSRGEVGPPPAEPFAGDQIRGFGFLHDGGDATLVNFADGFDPFELEDAEKIATVKDAIDFINCNS